MGLGGAESLVVSTEDESGNACIHKCSGTHRARFERGIHRRTGEAIVADACRSEAER